MKTKTKLFQLNINIINFTNSEINRFKNDFLNYYPKFKHKIQIKYDNKSYFTNIKEFQVFINSELA